MIPNLEKIDSVAFSLRDVSQGHDEKELKGKITTGSTYLELSFEGYGDFCSQDGSGSPIASNTFKVNLESWSGQISIRKTQHM